MRFLGWKYYRQSNMQKYTWQCSVARLARLQGYIFEKSIYKKVYRYSLGECVYQISDLYSFSFGKGLSQICIYWHIYGQKKTHTTSVMWIWSLLLISIAIFKYFVKIIFFIWLNKPPSLFKTHPVCRNLQYFLLLHRIFGLMR